MHPKLTIAIPTYNRVERLKETIERVIEETKDKDVEILVSDNASTDGTESFMKGIAKDCAQINYYRRNENGGFDANFLNCFNKANGEYVMLLGDDDVLLPGAVDSILKCIEKNPVVIYLNTSNLISRLPLRYVSLKMNYKDNIEYSDKNLFLKSMGIYCTFISAMVFDVNLIKKISNKGQFSKTNIIQSHILFETLKNDGKYMVNVYNCVAAQGNETVNYDVYNTWIKNYSELLLVHGKECGFDEDVLKEQLHKDLKGTIYNFVVNFRRTCKNQSKWDKQGIWGYINMFPDLVWKYRFAIYTPKLILKCIFYIKKLLTNIQKN